MEEGILKVCIFLLFYITTTRCMLMIINDVIHYLWTYQFHTICPLRIFKVRIRFDKHHIPALICERIGFLERLVVVLGSTVGYSWLSSIDFDIIQESSKLWFLSTLPVEVMVWQKPPIVLILFKSIKDYEIYQLCAPQVNCYLTAH